MYLFNQRLTQTCIFSIFFFLKRISLACDALNLWSLIQPDDKLKQTLKIFSQLMDLADYGLNTTLQLTSENSTFYNCTNDPFIDYYVLTKNLNLLNAATTVRK